jgi:hypothetical protein
MEEEWKVLPKSYNIQRRTVNIFRGLLVPEVHARG